MFADVVMGAMDWFVAVVRMSAKSTRGILGEDTSMDVSIRTACGEM